MEEAMKTFAITLLLITVFVLGMAVQNSRWEVKTVNWINPEMVDTVPNPFSVKE
jgi:hypothetical protein